MVRNLDRAELSGGLNNNQYVVNQVFPLGMEDQKGTCSYLGTKLKRNKDSVFLVHAAEGVDEYSNNEIECMSGRIVTPGHEEVKIFDSKTTLIHAVAITSAQIDEIVKNQISVVWSPRSNMSLYGYTAPVELLKKRNVNVALATDWTPSGSINMLRELQCAASYNENYLGATFSDEELWEMATKNAAKSLGAGSEIGSLSPGYKADIAVFSAASRDDPFASVIAADSKDVVLTVRGGHPISGDLDVIRKLDYLGEKTASGNSKCESIGSICGVSKAVCLGEKSPLYSEIAKENSNSYKLEICDKSEFQPSCIPARYQQYEGKITATDSDGDGVINTVDNCPNVFNPPRPMDGGKQMEVCGG